MNILFNLVKKSFLFFVFIYFYLSYPALSQTSFIKYYPKIISANKDGLNEMLVLNYNNDEGKNLILKIYDIKGLMVLEKKVSNTIEEKPESNGSYSINIDITNSYNDLFNIGTYIFVLTEEQKVLFKGCFAIVK